MQKNRKTLLFIMIMGLSFIMLGYIYNTRTLANEDTSDPATTEEISLLNETNTETTETTTLVTETPTTNDGILVKANQSVTVSVTSEVSVPINTVVTAVSNVTSAVKTASEKEAVATVETNEAPAVVASEDSKPQVTTGTVVVNIELAD